MDRIMITLREAMIQLDKLNMTIRAFGSLQWQVLFREDKHIKDYRLCDTLEECIVVSHDMRKGRNFTQYKLMTMIH